LSFFKTDKESYKSEDNVDPYTLKIPLYFVDSSGKGKWIRPIPPLSTDYDEDVIY